MVNRPSLLAKLSLEPSGTQAGSDPFVSCAMSVPLVVINATDSPVNRFVVNAILLPSGLQAGSYQTLRRQSTA